VRSIASISSSLQTPDWMARLFVAAIVLAWRSKPSSGGMTWKKPLVSTTSKPESRARRASASTDP